MAQCVALCRCVSYYFLPPMCTMEQDPADTCCQRARCYPEKPSTTTTSTTPVAITAQTASGPSGTGPTVKPGSTFTSHTGTGTVINITPNIGTGPSGTGPTVNPGSTFTSHTGTGTVINITPNIGTGPSGTGPTVNPGSTFTSHTGTGTVAVITPETPTGISGTKSTPGSLGSTFTDHTGTGPVINITPNIPTGPSGTGPTVNISGTITSHTGAQGRGLGLSTSAVFVESFPTIGISLARQHDRKKKSGDLRTRIFIVPVQVYKNFFYFYWVVQWSFFAQMNALCNLSHKKSREVPASLLGRFLSRRCFTLCITIKIKPRMVKQYKCHHFCSSKNYQGKGMKKKCLCIVFQLTRRLRVCRKNVFWASYSTSNKLLLVARHILTTGLQKCL